MRSSFTQSEDIYTVSTTLIEESYGFWNPQKLHSAPPINPELTEQGSADTRPLNAPRMAFSAGAETSIGTKYCAGASQRLHL